MVSTTTQAHPWVGETAAFINGRNISIVRMKGNLAQTLKAMPVCRHARIRETGQLLANYLYSLQRRGLA